MKIKKLLKWTTLICSLFVLLLFNSNDVSAATQQFYSRAIRDANGNVRFRWTMNNGQTSVNSTKIMKWTQGTPVYCIEPGKDYIDFSEGSYNFTDNQDSVISLSSLSQDTIRKLKLISHYGFGYGDHTDDSWYLSTQLEIWNTVSPGCCHITSGDVGLINSQRETIKNLVNSATTVPSFQNRTFTQVVGSTIEYTDTNNVLSNYSVSSCTNCSASISGNKLSITPTKTGSSTIKLIRNISNSYSPSILYYNGDAQKLMEFGSADPVNANLYLDVIGGKIQIKKVDTETNSTTPQGQASLVGAKYQVIDSSGNVVDTLTIGSDNTAITKNLPLGTFTIKEISSPTGYELNKTEYKATITNGDTVNIIVDDQVIKNYISILKQYDYVDGNTTFLNAEQNIVFEIFDSKGNKYTQIETDKNGYATIDLPYGVWKFHQVNSHTGFEKIYDFYITVDENTDKEQYYNILNNKLSAYLQVFKTDSETGKTIAIADTTFKILNVDTNKYVSQYVGGKVYDTFKTDETGKFITYLKLEAGNYKLIEISNPNGYLLNNDGLSFTIGNDTHYSHTTYGAFITIYFENKPIKAQIEISKFGEDFKVENNNFTYDKKPLENIVFEIIAYEDILSSDKNYLYYEKGTIIEEITTNELGYAISSLLPLGKYIVKEKSTNDLYTLDTTEYLVELKEVDNKTEIVYKRLDLLNYLKKGNLIITKVNDKNNVLAGAEFNIYAEDKTTIIYSGITTEDGKLSLELPVGKFYIKEIKAPENHVLNDEMIEFEIKEDNEVIEIEMINEIIKGNLALLKVDSETNNPLENAKFEIYNANTDELVYTAVSGADGYVNIENIEVGKYYILEIEAPENHVLNSDKVYFEIKENNEVIEITMTNDLIKGDLVILKVDSKTGDPLENAKFEIYNADTDELVYTAISGVDGIINIENIEVGKYYIVEIEAPENYNLNNDKVYFEINENDEVIEITMTNEKIEMPETFDTDLISNIFIAIVAIFGIGILVYEKKKNK